VDWTDRQTAEQYTVDDSLTRRPARDTRRRGIKALCHLLLHACWDGAAPLTCSMRRHFHFHPSVSTNTYVATACTQQHSQPLQLACEICWVPSLSLASPTPPARPAANEYANTRCMFSAQGTSGTRELASRPQTALYQLYTASLALLPQQTMSARPALQLRRALVTRCP
jgi:hypothetical protein